MKALTRSNILNFKIVADDTIRGTLGTFRVESLIPLDSLKRALPEMDRQCNLK
jgi:hypothetical protein